MTLSGCILEIDTREQSNGSGTRIKLIQNWAESHGALTERNALKHLDYHMYGEFRDCTINLGIEYKTLNDFMGSYESLKERFSNARKENAYSEMALFVELKTGGYSWKFETGKENEAVILNTDVHGKEIAMPQSTLDGLIDTLQRSGIHVRLLLTESQFPITFHNLLIYIVRNHKIIGLDGNLITLTANGIEIPASRVKKPKNDKSQSLDRPISNITPPNPQAVLDTSSHEVGNSTASSMSCDWHEHIFPDPTSDQNCEASMPLIPSQPETLEQPAEGAPGTSSHHPEPFLKPSIPPPPIKGDDQMGRCQSVPSEPPKIDLGLENPKQEYKEVKPRKSTYKMSSEVWLKEIFSDHKEHTLKKIMENPILVNFGEKIIFDKLMLMCKQGKLIKTTDNEKISFREAKI